MKLTSACAGFALSRLARIGGKASRSQTGRSKPSAAVDSSWPAAAIQARPFMSCVPIRSAFANGPPFSMSHA